MQAARKFKVGLIVIGSGFMFMSLVLFILGASLNSEPVEYDILFDESVKGMVIGSKVNFQGIPVGSVSDIRFQNGKTRVRVEVDPAKAPIQDVTTASMDRLLITGQVTVELEGHKADGKSIPRGALIPARLSAFDEFAKSVPEVLADVDGVFLSLKRLIDRSADVLDDQNRESLRKILSNMDRTTATIADRLGPLIDERLRPALASVESNFEKIGSIADSADLRDALTGLSDAVRRVDRIEAEVLGLLREMRGVVGGSRRSVLGTLNGAREALSEIQRLCRSLRLAPSAVVFGRSNSEIDVPAQPPASKGR